MVDKVEIEKELDELIDQGRSILHSVYYLLPKADFVKHLSDNPDVENINTYIENLPTFRFAYQGWYSKAQHCIKDLLPARLDDFNSFYEYPKSRSKIDIDNYGIKDWLQGRDYADITPYQDLERVVVAHFEQQFYILEAAQKIVDSKLANITAALQADLFDTEIESAQALAKNGFLRAAGTICGVVLEKHLAQICENHQITMPKKNPTLADYYDLLKKEDVIDVPKWRQIQLLADLRNRCAHNKDSDPTSDNVDDLIEGTNKVLKTVY